MGGPSPRGRGNPAGQCPRRTCRLGAGPSPRGRGNPEEGEQPGLRIGSIPAWAGKPCLMRSTWRRTRVHPRVGGETTTQTHPGERGVGPSPRGRGNLADGDPRRGYWRSIPAWAGKPPIRDRWIARRGVHPRVGGETARRGGGVLRGVGPSPRGRGNRGRRRRPQLHYGSIPAWAGKPRPPPVSTASSGVHPRVGGET